MQRIYLKVLRSLLKYRLRTAAIVLTVAISVAVFTGIYTAIKSIFHTQSVLNDQTHFADLEVLFLPEDINNIPDLSDIDGIKNFEYRLMLPGIINLRDGKRLAALMIYLRNQNPSVNSLQIKKGKTFQPTKFDHVVIERGLAKHHGFSVGDTIHVKIGESESSLLIDGVAFSPEFFTTSSNPDYFIPEKGSLGIIFGNIQKVSDVLGFTMVNDLVITCREDANIRKVQQTVAKTLKKLSIERVMTRHEHFSYRFLQMDLNSTKRFIPAIVLVLGALASLLTLITFNRLVNAERKEIGILMALGYSRRTILNAYLSGAFLVGSAGCILGVGLSFLIREAFAITYSTTIDLPPTIMITDPKLIGMGILIGFTVALFGAFIPLWRLLYTKKSKYPQYILKQYQSVMASKESRPSRIFENHTLPFRFAVRNLIRNRTITVSMIVSMGLALSVPISYGISSDSLKNTVRKTFEQERWQVCVDFLYPVFQDDFKSVIGFDSEIQYEPYIRRTVEITKDGTTMLSGLLGIMSNSKMKRNRIIKGNGFSDKEDEIIVSKDLADKMTLNIGDIVQVRVEDNLHPFTIVGITSEIIVGQSIAKFNRIASLFNYHDEMTGAYLANVKNVDQLLDLLYQQDFVGRATQRKKMVDDFMGLLMEMKKLITLASIISIFVVLLFLFTSLNMTISERESEFATWKAIGYGTPQISKMILYESMIQGTIAAILSVPCAIATAQFLLYRMGKAWFEIDPHITIIGFLSILIPALLLIPIWSIPGIRYASNLNIAQTLSTKSIE